MGLAVSTDPVVVEAAHTYTNLPANYGEDANLIRICETDAFIAGVAWLVGHPDEYQRLRKDWP
jgi:hypothetical protein